MTREISRRSYVDSMNRMQVVIETSDGRTHVLNFSNYMVTGHSHIVYKNGSKEYNGTYENRECYEHGYTGNMVDYYDAVKVDRFPYTFEQIYDAILDLSSDELLKLKDYLISLTNQNVVSKSR